MRAAYQALFFNDASAANRLREVGFHPIDGRALQADVMAGAVAGGRRSKPLRWSISWPSERKNRSGQKREKPVD